MLGVCFLVSAYVDQKKSEARERAQGPEGAPLVRRDTKGEARAVNTNEKNEKES